MTNDLLDNMNEQQREAILHKDGPLLILAGAGSGKTRVMVHRIANLVKVHGVPPSAILAVTFTNKATNEMKVRIGHLLPASRGRPIVSTFHSLCARLLRRDGEPLARIRPGFTRRFNICDEAGQLAIIKAICKAADDDSGRANGASARDILSRISHAKNLKQAPRDVQDKQIARVYRDYERELRSSNSLDFDDLLIEAVHLLEQSKSIREQYNQRIQYMLVDEYQDTNRSQYELMCLLTRRRRNICVVGDEDQCIYTWRGADIRNILDFRKEFPDAREIKLEQNYRSTKNILEAAGAVVRNNRDRVGKTLWTQSEVGEKIGLYTATDGYDEARFIVSETARTLSQFPMDSVAVLYRTNFQSRLIEQALTRAGIKYTVLGGVGFWQRAEIMDIIAYLKLALSPSDSVSFRRVVNWPRRGIGNATLKQIEDTARERNTNLWTAMCDLIRDGSFGACTQSSLGEFQDLVQRLGETVDKAGPVAAIEAVFHQSGYLAMLETARTPEAAGRLENVRELLVVAAEAEKRGESLSDLLDTASLTSSADPDPGSDASAPVTLMTLHAAKGLEFPVVFLAGMDEGLFPHSRADTEKAIDEERRLCYVGMTRARQRLILTRAEVRHTWVRVESQKASRFLSEIPTNLLEDLGPRFPLSDDVVTPPSRASGLARYTSLHSVILSGLDKPERPILSGVRAAG
jgi:DNA helicase-2/ATP-dependent DNA helicase PcrA